MNRSLSARLRLLVISVCALFVIGLFSACATGTNGAYTITGSVQSVNATGHSVTLNVAGRQVTVNGLTDQEIAQLQQVQGKMFTFNATQNGNEYTITTGTNPTENDNGTPQINEDTQVNTPSIEFSGKVLNVGNNSITVAMPGGQSLVMNIVNGQTDLSEVNGTVPTANQTVKVKALANTNGSFLAEKFSTVDATDIQGQSTVQYQGVTTSAVGSDGIIHFNVGNKSFSYQIATTSELKNFANAQAIGNTQQVKVEVLFNGSTGTVQKVENATNG